MLFHATMLAFLCPEFIYSLMFEQICQLFNVKRVRFYIAQYPVHLTAQSALHFSSPGRPVHSDTNSASLGSILAMQHLRALLF